MGNDLFEDIRNHAFWGTILLLFGVILGSVGCARGETVVEQDRIVDAPAGWDVAADVVAKKLGVKHQPEIYWYGKNMDCEEGKSWVRKGFCIDGDYAPDSEEIVISVRGGAPIHETALAHELCHALEFEAHGFSDNTHRSDCFVNQMPILTQMLIDGGF